MAKTTNRRRKGRHRGASARANADLSAHLASLGIDGVSAYQSWCRDHGLSGALNKSWQERRQERALAQQQLDGTRDEAALDRHIKKLGFSDRDRYQKWCVEHGLGDALHKSEAQRRKELSLSERLRGDSALKAAKRHARRPADVIQAIFDGTVDDRALKRPLYLLVQEVAASLPDAATRDALRRILLQAESVADLLGLKPALSNLGPTPGNTFVEGLGEVARRCGRWLAKPETWRPSVHNSRRQFGGLVRHLLCQYDVPAFMDAIWLQGKATRYQQDWFLHVGNGGNIRKAGTPVDLTKRMAHLFLQAPDGYTIEEALRWGQILGLGGDTSLVDAVNATHLGRSFAEEAFWSKVVHFFVNNPMLDPDQVGPMVDYIQHRKFEPAEIVHSGGERVVGSPPQPNFSVKGRSINKLLQEVDVWHRQLARETRLPDRKWEASNNVEGFELEERKKPDEDPSRWTITELLSSKELKVEGNAMGHCVASYAGNCKSGKISVWSMRVAEGDLAPKRVMTVSVHNNSRRINQARGKHNALPNGKAPNGHKRALEGSYRNYLKQSRRILRLWQDQEGLTLSKGA